MLLLNSTVPDTEKHIVLIFGVGLLGNAIHQFLVNHGQYTTEILPFNWADPEQQLLDAEAISSKISNILFQRKDENSNCLTRISFVWSAGKGGFLSTEAVMEQELKSYMCVLNMYDRLNIIHTDISFNFHLVSSAGGMHEGVKFVDDIKAINPCRPYGMLKQEQERVLIRDRTRESYTIYRPASVYGYVGNEGRLGLVPTLFYNCHFNKVTTIYGNINTLRDYVPCQDIGKYISDKIRYGVSATEEPIKLLASGKPTSILEIKNIVEKITGKKVYLTFRDEGDNSSDITFSPSVIPVEWQCTDIGTGIRDVGRRLFEAVV